MAATKQQLFKDAGCTITGCLIEYAELSRMFDDLEDRYKELTQPRRATRLNTSTDPYWTNRVVSKKRTSGFYISVKRRYDGQVYPDLEEAADAAGVTTRQMHVSLNFSLPVNGIRWEWVLGMSKMPALSEPLFMNELESYCRVRAERRGGVDSRVIDLSTERIYRNPQEASEELGIDRTNLIHAARGETEIEDHEFAFVYVDDEETPEYGKATARQSEKHGTSAPDLIARPVEQLEIVTLPTGPLSVESHPDKAWSKRKAHSSTELISERIRQLRKHWNRDRYYDAAQLMMPEERLIDLENGTHRPTDTEMERLSKYFKVPVDWIIYGRETFESALKRYENDKAKAHDDEAVTGRVHKDQPVARQHDAPPREHKQDRSSISLDDAFKKFQSKFGDAVKKDSRLH